MSVLALDEYTDLKKKFDIETNIRKRAEEYATEVYYNNSGGCPISFQKVIFVEGQDGSFYYK